VALDTELHREVALKQILDDHADDPLSRHRFLLEAEITGGLEHPGIIPVYGLGTYGDGRPYYAMRFIRGDSLKEAIERFHTDADVQSDHGRRSLALRKLLRRFLDVCNAIDYAHSRGVLHRDIKPGNVLVGQHGETLVVDWGLAKPTGQSDPRSGERTLRPSSASESVETLPGSAMGTPAYMSPEQAAGDLDRLGPRSDVYSLGATLYCLLTGRPPLAGSPGEVLRAVQRGEFPPPRAIVPAIDRPLEAVCQKAMALKPEDRYSSCRAVAEDIERWMADEPVSAWREPVSRRARRWARRHRPAVTGAAVALSIGLIGLAAGAAFYLQQRRAQVSRLELALREVNLLRGQAQADSEGDPVKWNAALQAVKRAEDLLGPLIDLATQRRVRELGDQVAAATQAAERDAQLLREVVDIRSSEADDPDGSASDAAYARAFRDAEIDLDKLGPAVAGARIRSRPSGVVLALAAVLDDWAAQRRKARPKDVAGWNRLVAAVRAVDPEPTRDRLRGLWSASDRKAQRQPLLQLARNADPRAWQPASLTLLAGALYVAGEQDAAADLLRRAEAEHPGDVWVNYNLARLLERLHPPRIDEAIRFYTAARAVRPETAHELAHALDERNRENEALAVFRNLTELRPGNGKHWACLGGLLTRRGDRASAEKALQTAVTIQREAIRRRPDDAVAHVALGLALCDVARDYPAAIAEFREAIRLEPDSATAHANLGIALIKKGNPDEAVEAFSEAIRLEPDTAGIHHNLGRALLQQRKVSEAIAAFREEIRLRPDDAKAHGNLGFALIDHLHDYPAAETALREAIRLQPDDAKAHYNLGVALERQGKLADAMPEYRAAIRLKPEFAEAHHNLGVGLSALSDDYPAAEAEFRAAIQLKHDYASAHDGLGRALADQGKLAEAVAAYREAIRLKPDDPGYHYNLGNSLKHEGKVVEAMTAYRETIRLNPDYAEAHTNLGSILESQGKLTEAIAAHREAIRLKPDLANAHNNLGNALWTQGKFTEAVAAYREAIRIKPDFAEAHWNLGRAMDVQGKLDEAVAFYREVIRIKPDYAEAHCNLGHKLQQRGQLREALIEIRRGHELGSKRPGWPYPSAEWVSRAERLVVLESRFPAVLRGDDKPKDALEGIDFADLAYKFKRFALSAGLYAGSLRADPELAEDMKSGHRYNAACYAALAGAGKGEDKPPLGEPEKARWRKQALDSLRADLAFWTKHTETGKPEAKALVKQTLQHWKEDSDLAGIRDETAINALPNDERKACQALWAEVDEVLAKVGAGTASGPHR
jgi:tetratricopeptide (TPR) repeat protein/tRNA A-37 threonylcarbamoyl transferase component Bud32